MYLIIFVFVCSYPCVCMCINMCIYWEHMCVDLSTCDLLVYISEDLYEGRTPTCLVRNQQV